MWGQGGEREKKRDWTEEEICVCGIIGGKFEKNENENHKIMKLKKQDLGLKCSAWKVFGSNDFGLVALYHKNKLDLFG